MLSLSVAPSFCSGDAPPAPSAGEIVELVRQLGADDYFAREQAQTRLAGLGFEAFDALTAAESDPDLEIATRARHLLKLMRVAWTDGEDSPAVKSLLAGYEGLAPLPKSQKIHALGGLADDESLPALCRLARFERSALLSKLAATEVLAHEPADDTGRHRRATIIRKLLAESTRPAARWLLAASEAVENPDDVASRWRALVDEEVTVFEQHPADSQLEILSRLLRWHVELCRRLDRRDDARESLRRLVSLQDGRGESLTQLLAWLTELEAWEIVDELAARFESRLNREPGLLYALARARQQQGDPAAVDEAVRRARSVLIGEDDGRARLQLATQLQREGQAEWTKAEYRLAVQLSPKGSVIQLVALRMMAEYLHDQEEDVEAADALEQAADAMDENKQKGLEANNAGVPAETVRARMKYLRSCYAVSQGDQAAANRWLEEAIEHDRFDAEVIIGLFRLPEQNDIQRQRTRKLLAAAVEHYRQQIAQDNDNETLYNQLAWLIGNTTGDFDEAIRLSEESLRRRPNEAGYLDTLARCHYAKGDLVTAHKYQAQAAKLEPHTRQIQKQLAQFEKELAARAEKK